MKETSTAPFYFKGFILMILGFFALLATDESLNKLSVFPAMILSVAGASISVFAYFAKKNLTKWVGYFISGLIVMGIGVFIMVRPELVIRVLFVGFGLWFIYQSALEFMSINNWRNKPHRNWWQLALLGIIEAVIGIMIMINPLAGTMKDTMFLGACMLLGAVVTLVVGYNLSAKFSQPISKNEI